MKILSLFIVLIMAKTVEAQNVGIGTTTPVNGRLVVRGTVGAVAAMFGDNTTGVAIENSFPGIALNTYFNGTRKFIAGGFGALIGLNPVNGDMYMLNTAVSGVADANASLLTRLFINGANGQVGIGTASTNGKLTIDATGNSNGIALSSISGTGSAILSENFSATGSGFALRAYSQNGTSITTSTLGNGAALYASAGANGYAVQTSGKSLFGIPVFVNNAVQSFNTAVTINANALDYGLNVYGNDASTSIYGYNSGSGAAMRVLNVGTGNGLNAEAIDAGAYALYANGRVHVQGTLSKSAGSFKIDHPQDPANKFLIHSFVESPDMMNIYNGDITTDADGYATVKLPDYFEAENIDFKYQLTVMGKNFAQALLYQEIKDNAFIVKTDKPNIKLSWQVTGVRNDAYAKKYRIVPVVQKTANEKGKYLAPDLFNQPKEAAIGYLKVNE